MKIGVYVNGTEQGLNSICAGEGRFAYNLVHALALAGHKVDALGSSGCATAPPEWGSQTPVENVTMVNYKRLFDCRYNAILNLPHDICVDGVWKKCSEVPLSARVICHNTFSWAQSIRDYYRDINKCWGHRPRHLVTVPYPFDSGVFSDKEFLRWLPFPYFEEFAEVIPSQRSAVSLFCKDVFSDEWAEDKRIHEEGLWVMGVISSLASNLAVVPTFITARTFTSNRAARLGVRDIFTSLDHWRGSDSTVLYDQCLSYLSGSRIAYILSGYAGSCFNAVAGGNVALFCGKSGFSKLVCGDFEDEFIADSPAKLEQISFRIFEDDDYYLQQLAKQRACISCYSYASCVSSFERIYEEFA